MDNVDRMTKVDFEKEKENRKPTNLEKEYMLRLNQQNLERVKRLTKIRTKNRFLGSLLGVGVISIYSYTMWAIKQESFLDDFNEPEKMND